MYGNCCQTKFRSRQLQPILQKAQNLLLRSTFQYSCTKKKFYTLLTLPYYFVLIVHIIVGKTVGKADFDNFLSNFILMFRNIFRINRQGVKKRIFYGQAESKGGGGFSPHGPDHKQMWNFWSTFSLKFESVILQTHFISCWGVSKINFSCFLHLY